MSARPRTNRARVDLSGVCCILLGNEQIILIPYRSCFIQYRRRMDCIVDITGNYSDGFVVGYLEIAVHVLNFLDIKFRYELIAT